MLGQYLGRVFGDSDYSGVLMVNFDQDRPTEGLFQISDDLVPHSALANLTEDTESTVKGTLSRFTPGPGVTLKDGERLPASGEFSAEARDYGFVGTWKVDTGRNGRFEIRRFEVPSARAATQTLSWPEFRNWALAEEHARGDWIFRGHGNSTQALVTTFHRTGRRNLARYDAEDVPRLHRHVEATIGKRYESESNAFEYGSLLALGQHHGFPTPLLDWTESPFVAAYFAFSKVPRETLESAVRIFAFNSRSWPYHFLRNILEIGPKFSKRLLGARDNPRALPQQSVAMFCNLADVESFVKSTENRSGKQFLMRIDIAKTERAVAMRELAIMGVTAASLFPGLDGTCKALTEAWF